MNGASDERSGLPEACYIRHITTGETVMIRRGEPGYVPVDTSCSPECLNAGLPRVPTEDEIDAMRHGSLMGWDGTGADPAFWSKRRGRTS